MFAPSVIIFSLLIMIIKNLIVFIVCECNNSHLQDIDKLTFDKKKNSLIFALVGWPRQS